MEHRGSLVFLLANGLTLILLIAILVGNTLWRKWHKELINRTKNLEAGRSCEEKILRQDIENKAKASKWRQADGTHVDLSQIVGELDSLCQVVSFLGDNVHALESREDLYGKVPVRILKSNDYLQGYQHVIDILEPVCGVNRTTNGFTLTRDELLQKLRQVKIHNGLTEDELLQKLGQGMKQMDNLVKELRMMLDELENFPPLEKIKDVSVAGVNFLCNFLGEATTWPRLHRTLDSSTYSYSL